ncbi:MAG: DUF1343 domain-containing protein [Bacteroidota bacterium]
MSPRIETSIPSPDRSNTQIETPAIQVGAEQIHRYLPLIEGKTLALVVNQTSMVGETHLVDTLQSLSQDLKCIFAPEHGFRDMAADGEVIKDGRDVRSGLPIISLYGQKKAPTAEDLAGVDLILFDIQDVGARFYTYISSLHYVMRAAAQQGVEVLVLDRPNPNGHIVDGPILDTTFTSFVGVHRVPVCHGMTVGEYALMVNGEGWLQDGLKADLEVITNAHYSHDRPYVLPVPPSPNLPNQRAIYLYPSLCFFEGTLASIGRGTNMQFQVIGHPDYPETNSEISFTPTPGPGSRYPKLEGKLCFGLDFRRYSADSLSTLGFDRINLQSLIDFMTTVGPKGFIDRTSHFDRLAGSDQLRQQLESGVSEAVIRASWQEGLERFRAIRERYLLYP